MKKLLALALALVLTLSLAAAALAAEAQTEPEATETENAAQTTEEDSAPSRFVDVSYSDYFAEPVVWALLNEITTGTDESHFSPDEDCTVMQILTFLWRAEGRPAPEGDYDQGLADGDLALIWAREQEFYAPDDLTFAQEGCTRSEAVYFLWLTAGTPAAGSSGFADVSDRSIYGQAVAWAVQQGITTGASENLFEPDTVCNRGQIVTFLWRAANAE